LYAKANGCMSTWSLNLAAFLTFVFVDFTWSWALVWASLSQNGTHHWWLHLPSCHVDISWVHITRFTSLLYFISWDIFFTL
jgi:hypothetical protein